MSNFNDEETDIPNEKKELTPEKLHLHTAYPTDCPTDKRQLPATCNTASKRVKGVDEASGDSKPAAGDQSSGPPSGGPSDEQSCTDNDGKDRDENQRSDVIRDYSTTAGRASFARFKWRFVMKNATNGAPSDLPKAFTLLSHSRIPHKTMHVSR